MGWVVGKAREEERGERREGREGGREEGEGGQGRQRIFLIT